MSYTAITPEGRKLEAESYLAERTGRLEYRFLRYGAVADELFAMGMDDSSLLTDLGAGMCDFDFYLRTVRGWKGRYLPVDAAIDGTDLESMELGWAPRVSPDFVTAIEVLEHLLAPRVFVESVQAWTERFVVTTPCTDTLGVEAVKAMDRTHVSPLTWDDLASMGFTARPESFFGLPNDSLIGVWRKP